MMPYMGPYAKIRRHKSPGTIIKYKSQRLKMRAQTELFFMGRRSTFAPVSGTLCAVSAFCPSAISFFIVLLLHARKRKAVKAPLFFRFGKF